MHLVHHLYSEVAVMQAGSIVEQGMPADVLRHPKHEYTRKLLAAVPMGRPNAPRDYSPIAPGFMIRSGSYFCFSAGHAV
jgi:peptide/nickel transport system ATP-binding protein